MATETSGEPQSLDERAPHIKSVVVTAIASLGGVAAGLVSDAVASGPGDTLALATLGGFALAGLVLMRLVGVDVSDFGAKDNLYVFFMTFALWFITWGILLTSA
ncbi:MAG: hypothetical protein ABEJ68_10660 [Halobacteriaceae archaeon]